MTAERIERLNNAFKNRTPEQVLQYFLGEFKDRIAFASSMGAEDQVITYMICQIDKSARIFTLDTGRLFPETYELIERTNKTYSIKIEVYFPDSQKVEEMVKMKGINLFYSSVENRKECCQVRKLDPMERALDDETEMWISGIRSEQSVTRYNTQLIEWDENRAMLKLNPLINWTEKQVWDYIKSHNIPYNPLHDKGFPSIGCQSCTRAIKPGDNVRSGRWWWEEPQQKECGIHKRN
jgi:phosphoadenosine phosphosulfate reductase